MSSSASRPPGPSPSPNHTETAPSLGTPSAEAEQPKTTEPPPVARHALRREDIRAGAPMSGVARLPEWPGSVEASLRLREERTRVYVTEQWGEEFEIWGRP